MATSELTARARRKTGEEFWEEVRIDSLRCATVKHYRSIIRKCFDDYDDEVHVL